VARQADTPAQQNWKSSKNLNQDGPRQVAPRPGLQSSGRLRNKAESLRTPTSASKERKSIVNHSPYRLAELEAALLAAADQPAGQPEAAVVAARNAQPSASPRLD